MNNTYYKFQNNLTAQKKIDIDQITDFFNQFSLIVSGTNQIINPDKEQKETQAALDAKKQKKLWTIFIVSSIIVISFLTINIVKNK